MKKTFLMIATVLFMAVGTIQAQEQGDMAIGANVAFGSGNDYSNVGVGVKFQYNVINNLRLEPSFTYFFEKNNLSMFDLSLNVHYQFVLGDSFAIYPLAGLSYLNHTAEVLGVSASDSEIGFNAGAGIDFSLTDALNLNAEVKYRVGEDWGRTIASIGLVYKF